LCGSRHIEKRLATPHPLIHLSWVKSLFGVNLPAFVFSGVFGYMPEQAEAHPAPRGSG
jgi:hypothetical protein